MINTGTGFYVDGMTNEEYHLPENGDSTSTIKTYMDDPASVIWGRKANQDQEKMKALDFGTDFHSYFLEPDVFGETYKVLPVFNRRKPAEKQAELDLIADWEKKGVIAVTDEDMKKLEAMRQSAMAHPTVNRIMNMKGTAERSYFWTDDETGMKLKCRPDWDVQDITDKNRPSFMDDDEEVLVVDAKTIAGFDRMEKQIEKLKYWVQDSFYTRGVSKVLGKKVCFIFIFVSTTIALGRYPVKVVKLSEASKFDGDEAINEALQSMSTREDWETVVTLDRPMWAVNNDDNI